METTKSERVTVEATVNQSIDKVWESWTEPRHITQWCAASDDWHAPHAENDLRTGGRFTTRMAARDGSVAFDFSGIYTSVDVHKHIAYTMDDGRRVEVSFTSDGEATRVVETFESESTHPVEMQREGWQSILNNFKAYAEKH